MSSTNIILLFFIFSFIGWIGEVALEFALNRRFVNRGFLLGPYCPIYGFAILFVLGVLAPRFSHPISLFFATAVSCAILEYATSFFLEKVFRVRWWDYSNFYFNLNGRICLEALTLFGVSSVLIAHFIQPFLNTFLQSIPLPVLNTIQFSLLCLFVLDCLISFFILKKVKKDFSQKIDATDLISKEVNQELKRCLSRFTK